MPNLKNLRSVMWGGHTVLLITFVAGMIDLVVLPLWITGLINSSGFSAQQAGATVSAYIFGVLVANFICGPIFMRLSGRFTVAAGFFVTSISFLSLCVVHGFVFYILAHLVGGLGAGAALSCVNGTIGHSKNPHRLFAVVNIGVGVFGILFFAIMPKLISVHGVQALFLLLSLVTALSVLAALIGFPSIENNQKRPQPAGLQLNWSVRLFSFSGVAFMTVAQSMIFSFLQKAGQIHGFSASDIGKILTVSAIINLLAPLGAKMLQYRLPAIAVAVVALLLHGCASLVVCDSGDFVWFAIAGGSLVFLVIFGHIFIFGFMSRIDPSGRLPALTPAMLMTGTAIGPILAGVVVQTSGYTALGLVAACFAWLSALTYALAGLSGVRDKSMLLAAVEVES